MSINDFNILPYVDKNINDAGPLEFLSLIRHSAAVVCSSFHASAFSIIFQRPFYVFPLKNSKNSSRMEDLLSLIHHNERFMPKDTLSDFNYSEVARFMNVEIERSKSILIDYIKK